MPTDTGKPRRYSFMISCHTYYVGLHIILTYPKFATYIFFFVQTRGFLSENKKKNKKLLQTSGLLVHMLHKCHKTLQR